MYSNFNDHNPSTCQPRVGALRASLAPAEQLGTGKNAMLMVCYSKCPGCSTCKLCFNMSALDQWPCAYTTQTCTAVNHVIALPYLIHNMSLASCGVQSIPAQVPLAGDFRPRACVAESHVVILLQHSPDMSPASCGVQAIPAWVLPANGFKAMCSS